MKIFSSLLKKKQLESFLAVDLGTDSVKVFIFDLEEGKVRVKGVSRKRYPESSFFGQRLHDLDSVLETADLAIEDASLQFGGRPEQTVLGVSGEVLKTMSDKVRVTRTNPEAKITPTELKNLYQKVGEKVGEKTKEKLRQEEGVDSLHLVLIGTSIGNFFLDGKRVVDPIEFSAEQLQFNVVSRFAKKTDLNTFENLVGELGGELASIRGGLVDLSLVLLQQVESGLIVDVGGEITQVALFKEGQYHKELSFALGGRSITRFLAKEFALSLAEAEKLKIDYVNGFLDGERTEKIRSIVKQEVDFWLAGLKVSLRKLRNEEGGLPEDLFLSGGGAALTEFEEEIRNLPNLESLLASSPKIKFVNPEDWEGLEDVTGKIKKGPDDSLCAQILNFAQAV